MAYVTDLGLNGGAVALYGANIGPDGGGVGAYGDAVSRYGADHGPNGVTVGRYGADPPSNGGGGWSHAADPGPYTHPLFRLIVPGVSPGWRGVNSVSLRQLFELYQRRAVPAQAACGLRSKGACEFRAAWHRCLAGRNVPPRTNKPREAA